MALSRAAKIEAAATIMEMMVAGESDDSIMAVLGMDAETFYEAKKFMLESKAAEHRTKPREHVYVEYVLDQKGNIRLVDNMLTKLDAPTAGGKMHYNAFVGAVRLRSDIMDRIMDRGFDLGILRKSSGGQAEVVGGFKVAGLTDDDLRKEIAALTKSTSDLVEMHSEGDLLSVDAGPTHHGPGLIDGIVEDDEAEMDAAPEDVPAPPVKSVAKPPVAIVRKKAVTPPAPPAKGAPAKARR